MMLVPLACAGRRSCPATRAAPTGVRSWCCLAAGCAVALALLGLAVPHHVPTRPQPALGRPGPELAAAGTKV